MGEDAEMAECFRAADDVLHNACAGIAEIINVPGLVNVDFEDVKTVMSERGKAMMGTATAAGLDRARIAAEQAVASPLLEGVDLSGARGVLVNITASSSLKMKETREVMNTIRAFSAEDSTVIFGTVCDEAMGDSLRVTVVATGLGRASAKKVSTPFTVIRTGTDNGPVGVVPATPAPTPVTDFTDLDKPAIWRTRRVGAGARQRDGGFRHRPLRHPGVPAEAGGLTMRRGCTRSAAPIARARSAGEAGRGVVTARPTSAWYACHVAWPIRGRRSPGRRTGWRSRGRR